MTKKPMPDRVETLRVIGEPMTKAQRREKSRGIIRAAAYVECASALDMQAQHYASTIRGRVGIQIANSIRQEADHLRDRAVEIKKEADAGGSRP